MTRALPPSTTGSWSRYCTPIAHYRQRSGQTYAGRKLSPVDVFDSFNYIWCRHLSFLTIRCCRREAAGYARVRGHCGTTTQKSEISRRGRVLYETQIARRTVPSTGSQPAKSVRYVASPWKSRSRFGPRGLTLTPHPVPFLAPRHGALRWHERPRDWGSSPHYRHTSPAGSFVGVTNG